MLKTRKQQIKTNGNVIKRVTLRGTRSEVNTEQLCEKLLSSSVDFFLVTTEKREQHIHGLFFPPVYLQNVNIC